MKRDLEVFVPDDLLDEVESPSGPVGCECDREEFAATIRMFVAELPEDQRHAIVRLYGLDGDAPDTCGHLALLERISKAGVSHRHRKALAALAVKIRGRAPEFVPEDWDAEAA